MSILSGLCTSYRKETLRGIHHEDHVYKFALIKANASGTYGKETTGYGQLGTDECPQAGGYLTGGKTLTGYAIAETGDTVSLGWDSLMWANSSISADGALIYNDSLPGKNAVCVLAFGTTKTSTGGDFDITIPISGVGLIRWK
jgi:hypothetical protein